MGRIAGHKRILVTGATGFIGSALVRRLEYDHEVFAFYRDSTSVPRRTAARWIQQDLRQPLHRAALPARMDVIVHMAYVGRQAPPMCESDLFTVNAACCASLLAYAVDAGAQTMVYGSTGGVYGRRPSPARESTKPAPYDYYTLSKYQGECLVRFQPRWTTVIVRYYYPYGPGQTNGVVPQVEAWVRELQPITVYNRARNPWINPVHIDDACELTLRAMDLGRPLIVNCAGGEKTNRQNLARSVGALLGVKPTWQFASDRSVSNLLGAIGLAKRQLGWRPQVRLADGLPAAIGANVRHAAGPDARVCPRESDH